MKPSSPSTYHAGSSTASWVIPIEQQLIDGRYTVIERLGKGAMGVVYKAHDAVLDRMVAIKQMATELDDDPQLRQRFSQEARAAARLNHRNIITIYELHESDNELYIVMELLEGVDLATLMKRKVQLPLEAKLNMMAQVCDGLDYAHRKGIIHRDIKPANLHVSPSGTVTILDFGIARLAASKMTSTGGLIGTPDYMSPEQVMAGTLDARSDLFAIGAVTYELLAGVRPFEADSVTALLMKIAREPHVPLRERAPQLPDAAILLVERLLQKDPNHRPSTAHEVQQALLGISTDRPPLDAATVAVLARTITEETQRPRTPVPPTRPAHKSTSPPPPSRSASDSSHRLASLAIERGRALRESGDLAGAMKVFRSVLEIAPGNAEALRELEEMERAFARITASGRVAAPDQAAGEPAPTILAPRRDAMPPATGAIPAVPPPPPAAAQPNRSVQTIAVLAAALVVVIVLGGSAFYMMWSRAAQPTGDSVARSSPMVGSSGTALTTSSVVPPPAVAEPITSPAEKPAAAQPDTTIVTPVTSSAPATGSQPKERARGQREAPGATRTAPPSEPAARPSSPEPPTSTAPPETSSSVPPPPPPPEPEKPAAPANSVMVRHNHARALFKGGGYCEGPLQFLPDGLYFKTSASSDGRKDEKMIPFKSIEDYELDGDKIHIETDDKNWDFVAPKDVLQRILQLLKANVKR